MVVSWSSSSLVFRPQRLPCSSDIILWETCRRHRRPIMLVFEIRLWPADTTAVARIFRYNVRLLPLLLLLFLYFEITRSYQNLGYISTHEGLNYDLPRTTLFNIARVARRKDKRSTRSVFIVWGMDGGIAIIIITVKVDIRGTRSVWTFHLFYYPFRCVSLICDGVRHVNLPK